MDGSDARGFAESVVGQEPALGLVLVVLLIRMLLTMVCLLVLVSGCQLYAPFGAAHR